MMKSSHLYLQVLVGTLAFVDGVSANYARPVAGEATATAASPCAEVSSSASVALVNNPNGAY
jgi:hypothetical protein